MIDWEVERLRRLRASALQLRAVARALGHNKWTRNHALLDQGRCAAWRVARIVSGRLRAHPNIRCQRDAGVGTLLKSSLVAAMASMTAMSRRRAITRFAAYLKSVMRELDDARALTLAPDLSDNLGRSQREFRALATALKSEMPDFGTNTRAARPVRAASAAREGSPFLTI